MRNPFDAIMRISRRLAIGSDTHATVIEILRECVQVTGATAGGIFVSDHSRGLVPLATSSAALAREPGPLPARVAASQQPVHVHTREQVRAVVPPSLAAQAVVGVPLRDGRGAPGAMVLFGERQFGPQALSVVTVMADLVSALLRSARVEHEIGAHQRGLGTLADMGRSLAGVIDLEELLGRILDGAESLLGSVGGFVCLVDERDSSLRLGLFRWVQRDAVRAVMSHAGFREVLREVTPRLVVDASRDPVFAPLAPAAADRVALVSVPLHAERGQAGILVTVVPEPSSIETEHLSLIASFADQAALAILGAELHEEVWRQEAEMSAVVASIDSPVIVIDTAGRFLTINPAAEQLFHLTSDFDRGKPVAGRISPPEVQEFLLSGWGSKEFRFEWPMPATYRASANDLRNREQRTIGRVMVLVDLTREREVDEMKSDFVSVIGHELRTPITVIKGFIKTLLSRGDRLTDEMRSQALDTIAAQTRRLERLIEDLLFVSRVETHRPPLHLEDSEIVELCRGVMAELRAEWPDRGFHLETTKVSVPLVVDVAKAEQVLRHLVENALKYSEEDVWVRVVDAEEEITLEVVDTGVGIFSGDIPRLFQRFGQIDSSTTRGQGGAGMGLYICRRLVEVHGGRIWVESQLARGSTFYVALPKGLTVGASSVPTRLETGILEVPI